MPLTRNFPPPPSEPAPDPHLPLERVGSGDRPGILAVNVPVQQRERRLAPPDLGLQVPPGAPHLLGLLLHLEQVPVPVREALLGPDRAEQIAQVFPGPMVRVKIVHLLQGRVAQGAPGQGLVGGLPQAQQVLEQVGLGAGAELAHGRGGEGGRDREATGAKVAEGIQERTGRIERVDFGPRPPGGRPERPPDQEAVVPGAAGPSGMGGGG